MLTPVNVPYPIHASGHPAEDELKARYRWVRPRVAIPVPGEAIHLEANAAIARAIPGIRREVAHIGRLGRENGALVRLASRPQD